MRTFLVVIGGVLAWHLVDQVHNPIVALAALVAVGVFLLRTRGVQKRKGRRRGRRRPTPAGGA
jgi:hypothetical protein